MDDLTNDAKFLLSKMYAEYIKRRKDKVPKQNAVKFSSDLEIHEKLMPDWSLEDTNFTCLELKKHEYITSMHVTDYIFDNVCLTTKAIAYMENKFKDKTDEVLEYAAKIKGLIPFI